MAPTGLRLSPSCPPIAGEKIKLPHARYEICRRIKGTSLAWKGLAWKGWYAFRRGPSNKSTEMGPEPASTKVEAMARYEWDYEQCAAVVL